MEDKVMRICRILAAKKTLAGILALFMLLMMVPALSACSTDAEEELKLADYGDYGSRIARELAARFPFRSPGSDQETEAGNYLIGLLEELGYEPQVTRFSFQDSTGEFRTSRNISVSIPGSGFRYADTGETGETVAAGEKFKRQVIIGAHYDTRISVEQALPEEPGETDTEETLGPAETDNEPDWSDYTGIHDNASGVAVIMTLAREMQDMSFGYDVVLVLFGAGEADQAGAAHYAGRMDSDEIAATDAMYCIDGIYAGDKVYAHSGWNTLRPGNLKHYENRRKLYEATDVFYEYELYTNNGYMLYTNQSSIDVFLPDENEDEEPADEGNENPEDEDGGAEAAPRPQYQYREWTLHVSDYRPFDMLDIPIVFFDSGDYDIKDVNDMKESNNPAFGLTDGQIRHTPYDATLVLARILNQTRTGASDSSTRQRLDQLSRRINNTAFIIYEAVVKGVHNAVAADG